MKVAVWRLGQREWKFGKVCLRGPCWVGGNMFLFGCNELRKGPLFFQINVTYILFCFFDKYLILTSNF